MDMKTDIYGEGMTSLRTRERLVERLTERGIEDVRVLEAFREVPRHMFIDEALSSRAYEDMSLPIGYHQTISQPYIVAKMTESIINNNQLDPKPLNRVLEIGSGCGYQTAILSRISIDVLSIERIKPLQLRALNVLNKLKINNVRLIYGDGLDVIQEDRKFDAILSAAAVNEIPKCWGDLLEIGGKLVLPVNTKDGQKLKLIFKRNASNIEITSLENVFFVPLVKGVQG